VERLINVWDNPGHWQSGVTEIGDPQFYLLYLVKRHTSTTLHEECRFTFSAPSLALSLQGNVKLAVDGMAYSMPHNKRFACIHFPAPPYVSEIRITTVYAIISDLWMWREELLADILDELQPLTASTVGNSARKLRKIRDTRLRNGLPHREHRRCF
jgi:hypothetical protein